MKTIGVLGGIGPQATMDFERRVHAIARELIPPRLNSGYPPMVVWYCRHPPIIVDDRGRPALPLRPDPRLLEAARWLGTVADFLVIISNGVHKLQPQIEEASGRPVVSMVEATIAEVKRRGWTRVGVLALGEPLVYTQPLSAMGIACETIDSTQRDALDAAIFNVMAGTNDAAHAAVGSTAVANLRARGVDGVILGCTEIPFLVPDVCDEPNALNPTEILAQAAVRAAME